MDFGTQARHRFEMKHRIPGKTLKELEADLEIRRKEVKQAMLDWQTFYKKDNTFEKIVLIVIILFIGYLFV